jgi:hypothetical protein
VPQDGGVGQQAAQPVQEALLEKRAALLQQLAIVEGQLLQPPQQQFLAPAAPQGGRFLPDAFAVQHMLHVQRMDWTAPFAHIGAHNVGHGPALSPYNPYIPPVCLPMGGGGVAGAERGPQQLLGAFEQQVYYAGGGGGGGSGLVGMLASILPRHGAQQQLQTFSTGPMPPAFRGVGSRRPVQQADGDPAEPGGPHRNGSRRRPLPTDGTALAIPLLSAFDSIPGVSWILTCTHVLFMGAS